MSDTSSPARQSQHYASAALTLACLLWSGNFIVGRALRGAIDPETLNALRWCIAAAAFLPFKWRRLREHAPALLRHRWWIFGLALTGVIGFQQATYTALTLSPVANAVLLLATTPLMILASSAALGKARLGGRQGAAVLLSLFGVAILLGEGDPRAVLTLDLSAGDLWLLGAVMCWTAYTQLLRRAPRDIPGDVSLMASMLAGLPLLLGLALVFGRTPLSDIAPPIWAGVFYVGLGAALLAFRAWGIGVARKGPDAAGLYINLMPVMAIALAWMLLDEPITPGQMSGAAVILVALLLGARTPGNRQETGR